MGRPVKFWPSTSAPALCILAITYFTVCLGELRSADDGGTSRRVTRLRGARMPITTTTTTTEFPPDFSTTGVRLIAIALLVLLILLLLAWILLSRRIAALFRRRFIQEAPPDLAQRASWIQQQQQQQLGRPGVAVSTSEEEGAEDDKLISNFVTMYRAGQPRKPPEGGKQPLSVFTLRDSAETSQLDHTGDARSRAGSEEEFYTPNGSFRGNPYMIPVATSYSGSMISVATFPSNTPIMIPSAPASSARAPSEAVLPLSAAAVLVALDSPSTSTTGTSTITASGTAETTPVLASASATPTGTSPLTSVSVTPTLSRARMAMGPPQTPTLSATLPVRGNTQSEPSIDVWLSPQEMSADERTDEDGPCNAVVEDIQRIRQRCPSSGTYGMAARMLSDGSLDEWYSTQETADDKTDDERLYSAVSSDLCGRLMASSSESASTLTLVRHLHPLSNDSVDVWRSAPPSPEDKTDDEGARCGAPNNIQEDVIAPAENSVPLADSPVLEPGDRHSTSARKAQP